jgi:hypothetical protein
VSDSDDLEINTLHRFAKHSPRLVLQEYSHCEVPAGCGGVVIRWYDPTAGAPALVRLSARGYDRAEVWLDGKLLATSYCQLAPGEHVIAVHLGALESAGLRIIALGAMYDTDPDADIIHRGDARWRLAIATPIATWTQPGFADQAWSSPEPVSPELLEQVPDDDRWSFGRATETGQPLFAVPAGESWLRVTFTARGPAR